MIRLYVLTLILVFCLAGPSLAGAWPRERGAGFLSTSGTMTAEKDATGAVYGEYGLTDRLTLGVDVFGGMERSGLPSGDATIFLLLPLSSPEAAQKWAAHVGVGARYVAAEFHPSLEFGLSWGRGLKWGERNGWAALDASVNFARSPMQTITKLDATLGMAITPRTRAMGQIFLTHTDGRRFTTLATSLLFTPIGSNQTFQIGAEFPQGAGNDARLKLGIWREF